MDPPKAIGVAIAPLMVLAIVFFFAFTSAIYAWLNHSRKDSLAEDVQALCELLAANRERMRSGAALPIDIAREFTGEKPGNDARARKLLREAHRYSTFWR